LLGDLDEAQKFKSEHEEIVVLDLVEFLVSDAVLGQLPNKGPHS